MASKGKFIRGTSFLAVFFLCFFSACGRHHGAVETPYLFSGACSVEVISETDGAEILVDGIHVGEEHIKVNIPCGEKKIMVKKHGYMTYEHYLPVSLKQSLKVTVDLKKVKSQSIFALSPELIQMARAGKKIVDPSASPAEARASLESVAEAPLEAPSHAVGGTTVSPSPGGLKGAEDLGAPSGAAPHSVEDWR